MVKRYTSVYNKKMAIKFNIIRLFDIYKIGKEQLINYLKNLLIGKIDLSDRYNIFYNIEKRVQNKILQICNKNKISLKKFEDIISEIN